MIKWCVPSNCLRLHQRHFRHAHYHFLLFLAKCHSTHPGLILIDLLPKNHILENILVIDLITSTINDIKLTSEFVDSFN